MYKRLAPCCSKYVLVQSKNHQGDKQDKETFHLRVEAVALKAPATTRMARLMVNHGTHITNPCARVHSATNGCVTVSVVQCRHQEAHPLVTFHLDD